MRDDLRENLLLAALSPAARQLIAQDLHPAYLRRQTPLNQSPGSSDIYFPLTCVISVMSHTAEGHTVQSMIVGLEGALTLSSGHGLNSTVQIDGEALRLPRAAYLRLLGNDEIRDLMEAYRDECFALVGQVAVCQAFHPTEQRLAFWLSALRDRVLSDDLLLTQEYLASMLGVRRPTVTIAAGILQAAGLISYRYGRVTIVSRDGLRDSACECYASTTNVWRHRTSQ